MTNPLFREIAKLLITMENCRKTNNNEWLERHKERILEMVKAHMPSGAGFDAGTTFDMDMSTGDKLVFRTSYHHMTPNGFYSGWTEHVVTVKASLAFEFAMHVSGRNRNDIKEYITDCFYDALRTEID